MVKLGRATRRRGWRCSGHGKHTYCGRGGPEARQTRGGSAPWRTLVRHSERRREQLAGRCGEMRQAGGGLPSGGFMPQLAVVATIHTDVGTTSEDGGCGDEGGAERWVRPGCRVKGKEGAH
jgi:hypothetical protein